MAWYSRIGKVKRKDVFWAGRRDLQAQHRPQRSAFLDNQSSSTAAQSSRIHRNSIGGRKMVDVQNRLDERRVAIDQVGICDVKFPIHVLERSHRKQSTVADLAMSVALPQHLKGTHMSRFVEVLNEHRDDMSMRTLPLLLRKLRQRLETDSARIEITFPYFIERVAPASGKMALMDYECKFVGESKGTQNDFVLKVRVPVTTLCPCSKEISDYGAHNQRGLIDVSVRSLTGCESGERALVWIEDLVQIAEESASAPVYPLLKRADERHVTMQAYDNPVFVEDMVRNVSLRLQQDSKISWFKVHVVNLESIHNHSAFACLEWERPSVYQSKVADSAASVELDAANA
jgi:GTP cyclohydrolase IB